MERPNTELAHAPSRAKDGWVGGGGSGSGEWLGVFGRMVGEWGGVGSVYNAGQKQNKLYCSEICTHTHTHTHTAAATRSN